MLFLNFLKSLILAEKNAPLMILCWCILLVDSFYFYSGCNNPIVSDYKQPKNIPAFSQIDEICIFFFLQIKIK
jgi:hypothetical protein